MGLGVAATGVALGAMSISWAIASVVAGRLMLLASYRTTAILGGTMLALGCAVLAFLAPTSSLTWATVGSFLVGIGMGSCNTTYLVSVQAAAAIRERGAATASNMFMRIVGQSTGAALFGALLNAGLDHFAAMGHGEAMATSLRMSHRGSPGRPRRRADGLPAARPPQSAHVIVTATYRPTARGNAPTRKRPAWSGRPARLRRRR